MPKNNPAELPADSEASEAVMEAQRPPRAPRDFLAIERTHTLDDERAAAMGVAAEAVAAERFSSALGEQMAKAIADAEAEGRTPFFVALPARFAEYVQHRAAAHGETPQRHIETIIRRFWQNDEWRQTATAPTQPGDPAGTARKR